MRHTSPAAPGEPPPPCQWDCGEQWCGPNLSLYCGYVRRIGDSCPVNYATVRQPNLFNELCCLGPTPPQTPEECHSAGWSWNFNEGTCTQQPTCQLLPELCEPGSHWDYEWCSCVPNFGSPVLVDVSGDGFSLTDAAGGVLFDLDSDGAAERLAWTRADGYGNQFRYRAKVRDERGAQLGRWAWDVFLVSGR